MVNFGPAYTGYSPYAGGYYGTPYAQGSYPAWQAYPMPLPIPMPIFRPQPAATFTPRFLPEAPVARQAPQPVEKLPEIALPTPAEEAPLESKSSGSKPDAAVSLAKAKKNMFISLLLAAAGVPLGIMAQEYVRKNHKINALVAVASAIIWTASWFPFFKAIKQYQDVVAQDGRSQSQLKNDSWSKWIPAAALILAARPLGGMIFKTGKPLLIKANGLVGAVLPKSPARFIFEAAALNAGWVLWGLGHAEHRQAKLLQMKELLRQSN